MTMYSFRLLGILISIFLVHRVVANDLDFETWRTIMESRLLKLEHDVEVLSSENRRLKSENIKLKMKNTEQDKGIEILRNGNKQLHELIGEILFKHENADQQTVPTSNNNNSVPESSRAHLQLLESTNNTYNVVKRNGHDKQTRLLLQNTPTEGVAFYAYINSLKSELPAKHVMVYDTVITNHGNSYHKDDGIFIVPQNGIYVFSWSVAVQDGEWAHAEIVLNGSPFGSVMADTSAVGASDGGLSTGIAIKEVSTGDHVYIRTIDRSKIYSGSQSRTSFSGWLLF